MSDPRPAPSAGWYAFSGSSRAHYFRHGATRSLCGKWNLIRLGAWGLLHDGWTNPSFRCGLCAAEIARGE